MLSSETKAPSRYWTLLDVTGRWSRPMCRRHSGLCAPSSPPTGALLTTCIHGGPLHAAPWPGDTRAPTWEGAAAYTLQDTHTRARAHAHTHTHTHTRAWSGSQSRLREALRFLLWGLGHWPHEPLTPGLSPGMGRPLASGPRLLQSPQGVCEQVVGGASTGAPLGRAPLAVPAEAWTRPEVLTSHFT